MATILSIETATSVCSVAIHSRGELISVAEVNQQGAHAQQLMLLIEQVLADSGLAYSDLDALAVSEGPGSYTGLRIGVSTAKGLSFGLDKPLIGVNTLQALASAVPVKSGELILPVMDARRMEVYYEVFDSGLNSLVPLGSEVLREDSFENFLEKGRVYFMGDALDKLKTVVHHPNVRILESIRFSARHLGQLAYAKWLKSESVDLAYFVPNYLKEFKALQSKKNPLLNL
ncbi:tRNA (adenosine(37)-N6)-threonylcarbamoyltransferase complex dimerization subunit type 1 TsaB [Algoriphagus confluentis]|uniref:tRNA (Adenosine(37)-N6)-threonylcarbamoyltransferase complex dimerization subunit type 1 TsaB n=1 Tax=Algoriphagus confluentis TaxID=1697556 RepID=A0ABQ6PUM4_9BACT|nr:tRNA (adenosine(37)-N6)-threonylcarbamoyltransferase complex dimerization subunit type 1 TsaB [Algoriphagus confluentis]